MSASQAQAVYGFSDVAPVSLPHPTRMRILFAVMVGIFLAALDQTVVGTALPRIITDLQGNEVYTWAFTAYLLTSTISGPIYGKLSDLYGRRPIFLLGIGIFLLGSTLAGFSQSIEWLIVARGIQGLGAGALFPVALAIIGDIFAPSERGKYQGLFGAVFGVSIIIGPAIGGLLTDTIGWPWVFFINLPIGAVVIYLVWRYLPSYHLGGDRPRIDYIGAALFTAALVPILVGLTNAQTATWTDLGVGGLVVIGLVFLVAFVFVESRVPEPIVPLSLFRIRSFSVSVVGHLPCRLRLLRDGRLPAHAGSRSSPGPRRPSRATSSCRCSAASSRAPSSRVRSSRGRVATDWLIFVALLTMALGLWLLSNLHADTPIPILWAWMFIAGLGIGPTFAVFTLVVQNSVPVERLGTATSNLTLFQQVGGTVGLAVTGTIFASVMRGPGARADRRRGAATSGRPGDDGRGRLRPRAADRGRRPRSQHPRDRA